MTAQSPTSCRPIATHLQSVGNQSPTSRRPVADWSPIFRDSCRRPVADWSATEKCSFWSHSGCIGCSCFIVARQSPTGCNTCVLPGLYLTVYSGADNRWPVNSPHRWLVMQKMFPSDDVIMCDGGFPSQTTSDVDICQWKLSYFNSNFTEGCSQISSWQLASIASDNGLSLTNDLKQWWSSLLM